MIIMELLAPAKLNLYLAVVGRRDDGYHELRTLMCCVGVYDTIVMRMETPFANKPAQAQIVCDHPDVPSDGTNLACRAALTFNEALVAHTTIAPASLSINLKKGIPVGAGLGGGSSDAAAVLRALNTHYDRPFGSRRLQALALSLGADVPFFIDPKPALATGIGEKLTPYSGLTPMGVVIIYPGFGISTAHVFENLNLGLTKCEKQLRYFPFKNGKFNAARHLYNQLETVVVQHHPVIAKIKNDLLDQGAMGSLMTGSGSAVFGLFADAAGAQRAKAAMRQHRGWQVYATELIC